MLYKLYRRPIRCNNNGLLIIPVSLTCFEQLFCPSSGELDCVLSLWYNAPTMLPAGGRQHSKCVIPQAVTQSSAPEDGQNNCPKHVELAGTINKPLSLHLVGCLYYLY